MIAGLTPVYSQYEDRYYNSFCCAFFAFYHGCLIEFFANLLEKISQKEIIYCLSSPSSL